MRTPGPVVHPPFQPDPLIAVTVMSSCAGAPPPWRPPWRIVGDVIVEPAGCGIVGTWQGGPRTMTTHQTERLAKDGIIRTLREYRAVLDRYTARAVGLFGSFANGRQRADSDIDLLVEFERPTHDNFTGLTDELERLFGRRVEIMAPDGLDSIRVPRVAESIRKTLAHGEAPGCVSRPRDRAFPAPCGRAHELNPPGHGALCRIGSARGTVSLRPAARSLSRFRVRRISAASPASVTERRRTAGSGPAGGASAKLLRCCSEGELSAASPESSPESGGRSARVIQGNPSFDGNRARHPFGGMTVSVVVLNMTVQIRERTCCDGDKPPLGNTLWINFDFAD